MSKRHQLPLALKWASTLYHVQGNTLHGVVFDLRCPVLAHGHLYTGLTRVRDKDSLRLLVPESQFCKDGRLILVRNVVLEQLLLTEDRRRRRRR